MGVWTLWITSLKTKTLNWTCPYSGKGISRCLLAAIRNTDSDLFILWSALVWNTSCLAQCWLPGALKDIKLSSLYLQMEGSCLLKLQSQLSLSCPSSMWLSSTINRKETRIVFLIVHHFQRAKVLASKNLRSCWCNHLITKAGLWTSVLLTPHRPNHAVTPVMLAGNSNNGTWRNNEVPSKKKKTNTHINSKRENKHWE